jgi:aspartyl-tRNA(Asn)/glutamyl-tRNA(Gln) amidotransferase subunit A
MSPGAPPFAIFTGIFNMTGQPALSIPCGFDSNGVPVGISLIGKRWDEQTVLNAGAAYQSATDWHTRRPPLG